MTTKTILTHAELKTKQRAIREDFPETMGLRVHRAISWIGRAEACGTDDDAKFIFLWIAFNAAYADERPLPRPVDRRGRGWWERRGAAFHTGDTHHDHQAQRPAAHSALDRQ